VGAWKGAKLGDGGTEILLEKKLQRPERVMVVQVPQKSVSALELIAWGGRVKTQPARNYRFGDEDKAGGVSVSAGRTGSVGSPRESKKLGKGVPEPEG